MSQKNRNILIVINPVCGNGSAMKLYSSFFKYLQNNKVNFFPYHTNGQSDVENIRKLLEHKAFDTISVMGGDGTINTVLNAMGQGDCKLHIIPCGTGNDLALGLGPRESVRNYYQKVLGNSIREMDVFNCNDIKFAVGFGIGFDGLVAQKVEQLRNMRLPKKLSYWCGILAVLFSYKEVKIEGNQEKLECFMLSLANNKTLGGGFKIAPLADTNDELLEYVLIKKVSWHARLINLLRVKNGTHLGLDIVEYKRVKNFTIYSDKAVPAHLDGELISSNSYLINFDRKIKIYY